MPSKIKVVLFANKFDFCRERVLSPLLYSQEVKNMEKVHKVEVMSGGPTFEDPFASPAERIEVLPHTVLFDVVNEEIVPVGEPQLSLHNAVRQVVR